MVTFHSSFDSELAGNPTQYRPSQNLLCLMMLLYWLDYLRTARKCRSLWLGQNTGLGQLEQRKSDGC